MQTDSNADPRISKAQAYLRRIQSYCESEHAQVYETFYESPADTDAYEVTFQRFDVLLGIRRAVRILGGRCYQPRVEHRMFIRDTVAERHSVFIMKFTIE